MIHYHGLPITPAVAAVKAIQGGHAFISFRHADQLELAAQLCQSFAVDNGAFSAWKAGEPVKDWRPYYRWVESVSKYPGFDFAVIPDTIDGSEKDNDKLLREWPWRERFDIGAPVWHLHESLDRLHALSMKWPRVCLGSSGAYAQIGTTAWWERMDKAMGILCDSGGRPLTRIHGLRMLDPKLVETFPFASADSTNIARNIGLDCRWTGGYSPGAKDVRAAILRHRIELHNSPARYQKPPQMTFTLETL